MSDSFDLVVIGSGPGGYICAIRAAQLGQKVAIVEKRATHGGTCLNVGCIPSKALLHASEHYEEAGNGLAEMGIEVSPELNLGQMMVFKDEGVAGNVQGVEFLLKKNKITSFHGTGNIIASNRIEVTAEDGAKETITTRAIVVATGSDVATLPGIKIDEKRILSSTGALELTKVPKKLIIVGAGVIGLELGSVWRRLGAKVTVIEYMDRITPELDAEVAKHFQRILTKQGMKFMLGQKVNSVETTSRSARVTIEPATGGEPQTVIANRALISIGRRPYTEGLGLEALGVRLDNRGCVMVDDNYQTNVPGIFAIGDVITGPMLAHKAEDEGVALAELLAGQAGHVNYDVIPNVIYTYPEVASIGKTEEQLKQAGIEYSSGKFPFTANSRAKINRQTEGFVKVLADKHTDKILGVHIIGPDAGTMIAEAAVIMEFGGSSEDLARTCHAHPTLNEAVKEAALAVDKRALHM